MQGKTYKAAAMVAAVGAAFVLAAVASASGGVSIEQGNDWDGFPAASAPGDTVTVTTCTFQSGAEGSNATVKFSGLKDVASFVSSNDGAISSQNQNQVTIAYTDYAHSAKCDAYTFTLSSSLAPGSYPIQRTVKVAGVGNAHDTVYITIPAPTVPFVAPQINNLGVCAGQQFFNLDVGNYDGGSYMGYTLTGLAKYVQGEGLTCDSTPGYVDSGVQVDPNGVPQDGNNNTYDLWVPAA